MTDDDIGVVRDQLELLAQERFAAALGRVERPRVEPGLPGSAPNLEAVDFNAFVL
jgi:hypothetical protein